MTLCWSLGGSEGFWLWLLAKKREWVAKEDERMKMERRAQFYRHVEGVQTLRKGQIKVAWVNNSTTITISNKNPVFPENKTDVPKRCVWGTTLCFVFQSWSKKFNIFYFEKEENLSKILFKIIKNKNIFVDFILFLLYFPIGYIYTIFYDFIY